MGKSKCWTGKEGMGWIISLPFWQRLLFKASYTVTNTYILVWLAPVGTKPLALTVLVPYSNFWATGPRDGCRNAVMQSIPLLAFIPTVPCLHGRYFHHLKAQLLDYRELREKREKIIPNIYRGKKQTSMWYFIHVVGVQVLHGLWPSTMSEIQTWGWRGVNAGREIWK